MKLLIPKAENPSKSNTNYFIVVDTSGSMYGSVDALRQTLKEVIGFMGQNDTITIGRFSGYNSYEFFVRGLKKDANLEKLITSRIHATGLTCYNQILKDISGIVGDVKTLSGNDNFALYFLTDGYPNSNSPESETRSICKTLKPLFNSVFICGYSDYYNRNLLIDMAENIGGQMVHVTDRAEIQSSCEKFMKGSVIRKTIALEREYDIVWQVTKDDVVVLTQTNKTVSINEQDSDSDLYAIDFAELDGLSQGDLSDAKFTYSLAFVLSQKNKANLGVSVLRKAGALAIAKALQKSFTVSQKGRMENDLKALASTGGVISPTAAPNTIPIKDFLSNIKSRLGKVRIDIDYSGYKTTTRKGNTIPKVVFESSDAMPTIVDITTSENRANISFLTVRKGNIVAINDADLQKKVDDFNAQTTGKKIEFPFETSTFRNYALVSNGDFNFKELCLVNSMDDARYVINPERDLDLFDEESKDLNIDAFSKIYTALLKEKAHASALRYYIKANSEQKQLNDLRVNLYGKDGAEILAELGIDYELRFSPKSEYVKVEEDADYVPFLEIDVDLKGAATISASKTYEKYSTKTAKTKVGVADEILWPIFEKYDGLLANLGKQDFVEFCQTTLKGVEGTINNLVQKVSATKFYMMATNSWFDGVEKADKIEHNGIVIKTKETKEYV